MVDATLNSFWFPDKCDVCECLGLLKVGFNREAVLSALIPTTVCVFHILITAPFTFLFKNNRFQGILYFLFTIFIGHKKLYIGLNNVLQFTVHQQVNVASMVSLLTVDIVIRRLEKFP